MLVEHVLPWVEKYRPSTLEGIVAQNDIVTTIERIIEKGQLPHLLFYGPPGTGKTTMIKAIAHTLYPANYESMVLELNASDDRGINVVREQIREFASTRRIFSTGVKLIILDEADSMTSAAQAALRRVIERYAANVRFCLIGNYANNIIPALQSRCMRFRFGPLGDAAVRERVGEIARAEGVDLTDDGLEAIVALGEGDMRRHINTLQSAHLACVHVDADAVYAVTGNPPPALVRRFITAAWERGTASGISEATSLLWEGGVALLDVLRATHGVLVAAEGVPLTARAFLLEQFARIEENLLTGSSPSIQLAAFVSLFTLAKEADPKLIEKMIH